MSDEPRRYRAGDVIDDLCRACKVEREHNVLAVDETGQLRRVVCGFCGSQHNYRGGAAKSRPAASSGSHTHLVRGEGETGAWPAVSERERSQLAMSVDNQTNDIEMLLRRIIREETGLTAVVPADKWRGGELVLRPGRSELQEKSIPIESFFSKIVMLRNRLRTLEQQINGADVPTELKIKLQGYITGCYGSLTSFNILFADDDDRFKGAGGK